MREIENTRNQIQLSDLPQFDERIAPIKDEVQAGVNSFREIQQMYTRKKLDKEPKRMPFATNRNSGNVTYLPYFPVYKSTLLLRIKVGILPVFIYLFTYLFC